MNEGNEYTVGRMVVTNDGKLGIIEFAYEDGSLSVVFQDGEEEILGPEKIHAVCPD